MANQQDSADKTEKPTPKKLRDARKKGDVVKSRDVTNTLSLVFTVGVLYLTASYATRQSASLMERALSGSIGEFSQQLKEFGVDSVVLLNGDRVDRRTVERVSDLEVRIKLGWNPREQVIVRTANDRATVRVKVNSRAPIRVVPGTQKAVTRNQYEATLTPGEERWNKPESIDADDSSPSIEIWYHAPDKERTEAAELTPEQEQELEALGYTGED